MSGLVSGSDRVLPGGSWYIDPWYARAAIRSLNSPGYRDDALGVRLVRRVS